MSNSEIDTLRCLKSIVWHVYLLLAIMHLHKSKTNLLYWSITVRASRFTTGLHPPFWYWRCCWWWWRLLHNRGRIFYNCFRCTGLHSPPSPGPPLGDCTLSNWRLRWCNSFLCTDMNISRNSNDFYIFWHLWYCSRWCYFPPGHESFPEVWPKHNVYNWIYTSVNIN